MQRLQQLMNGNTAHSESPLAAKKERVTRGNASGEAAIEGSIVPRKVSRTANQRRESRHHRLAETARLIWSGSEFEASVVNVSESGLMIEAGIDAAIGDIVQICFEGCDPIDASVIWRKDRRIGVDFGKPAIELVPED